MQPPDLPATVTVISHPLMKVKLTRLRDRRTRPEEFRARLGETSTLLLIEATRALGTHPDQVQTPLAPYEGAALARPVVLVPILRAGIGMIEGMLSVLPEASVGHVGMRRDEQTHLPHCYYFNVPAHLAGADVILVDPMLATGHSASEAIAKLKAAGATRIRFICCVSCPEGLAHLHGAHPDVPIFTGAVDDGLDPRAYIVPGLGDAGDRYFGTLPAD
jgi:uracil phosphoribosyltransferase